MGWVRVQFGHSQAWFRPPPVSGSLATGGRRMSEQHPSASESDRRALALRLMGVATQFWVPQALYVAVTLGIAERLADGPRSSEDLAREVAVHPDRLRRLLRALSSVDVFAEDPD